MRPPQPLWRAPSDASRVRLASALRRLALAPAIWCWASAPRTSTETRYWPYPRAARHPGPWSVRSRIWSLNELFGPVCKWSVDLSKTGVRETITSALRVSTAAPPGPVYLTIPNDVAVDRASPGKGASTPDLTCGRHESLDAITAVLNRAERPVGIVGVALDVTRDSAAVRRFFSQSQIPYVVLPQAKGIADEFGPGYLGTVASAAGDAVLVNLIRRSDCLLGVGFDPVESAQDWHLRQPVYSLAGCSIAFGDFMPASECVGDVTILLDRLLEAYKTRATWTAADFRGARQGARMRSVPHGCRRQWTFPVPSGA